MSARYVWNKYTYTEGITSVEGTSGPINLAGLGTVTLCSRIPLRNSNGTYSPQGSTILVSATSNFADNNAFCCTYPYLVISGADYYLQPGYTSCSSGSPSVYDTYIVPSEGVNAGYLCYWNTMNASYGTNKCYSAHFQNGIKLGSLVSKVSSSNSYAYPADDAFSDRYYYEYLGSDTIDPISINYPSTITYLGNPTPFNYTITSSSSITFGGAISYRLSYRFNSNSWMDDASWGTSTSGVRNIISDTWNTVQLRVLTKDAWGFVSTTYVEGAIMQISQVEIPPDSEDNDLELSGGINGYVGITNVARKITKGYIGINAVAHQIIKGYVGVNNIAKLIYSSDAVFPDYNWKIGSIGTSAVWTRAVWGNGVFVLIGNRALSSTSSNSAIRAYSSDGINWTTYADNDTYRYYAVFFVNNKFYIFAAGAVLISTDGINWSKSTISISPIYVTVFKGYFIVTVSDTSGVKFYRSSDGVSWTNTYTINNSNNADLCSTQDTVFARIYAGSTYSMYISTDGISWSKYSGSAGDKYTSYRSFSNKVIGLRSSNATSIFNAFSSITENTDFDTVKMPFSVTAIGLNYSNAGRGFMLGNTEVMPMSNSGTHKLCFLTSKGDISQEYAFSSIITDPISIASYSITLKRWIFIPSVSYDVGAGTSIVMYN